jgi:hypothetical protein
MLLLRKDAGSYDRPWLDIPAAVSFVVASQAKVRCKLFYSQAMSWTKYASNLMLLVLFLCISNCRRLRPLHPSIRSLLTEETSVRTLTSLEGCCCIWYALGTHVNSAP